MRGMVIVPATLLTTEDALDSWVEQAVTHAHAQPPKTPEENPQQTLTAAVPFHCACGPVHAAPHRHIRGAAARSAGSPVHGLSLELIEIRRLAP